ncbi:MAG: acylneuraminate cytidylyltransferase family protein [Flavobacteriales bacterium]|nr:acylneuraminate cytidylyltransferase family protein [Flavobacteriales bacterium]
MRVLGIIPARGGSKRVRDKNIRLLNQKPLIAYTIEAAQKSKLLNSFIVSTDSIAIKKVAEEYEAEVPFMRPEELSNDTAGDRSVILHALEFLENSRNEQFDAVVYLRPTSPFKTGDMIDDLIRLLEKEDVDSVRSMTKAEGIHHPYWMFWKEDNGLARPFDPNNSINKFYQSQLLPDVYHLNGVVDGIKTSVIKDDQLNLYGSNMQILEIEPESAMDIDTEFDLKVCECLLNTDRI